LRKRAKVCQCQEAIASLGSPVRIAAASKCSLRS
jgi:hypothetical protein